MAAISRRNPAGHTVGVIEHLDEQLVQSFLQKRKEHKNPSNQERAAYGRWEKARRERAFDEECHRVPQKKFREMCDGIYVKQLQDWERNFDLPVARPVINLREFFSALRKLLGSRGRKMLVDADGTEGMLEGCSKNVRDRYVERQIQMLEIKIGKETKTLVAMDELLPDLTDMSTGIRKGIETLQRQFGAEAAGIMNDVLEEFDAKRQRLSSRTNESADAAEHR